MVLCFSYQLEERLFSVRSGASWAYRRSASRTARGSEALDLLGAGMDFADALHLVSSPEAAQFATFEGRLKKRADAVAPARQVLEA